MGTGFSKYGSTKYTINENITKKLTRASFLLTKTLKFNNKEKFISSDKNKIFLKIHDILKNEDFGGLFMFMDRRSPFTIRVRTKIAELVLLKKSDIIKLSKEYPNIWRRINKKAVRNMKGIKKQMIKTIDKYCSTFGVKSKTFTTKSTMKNLKRAKTNWNSMIPVNTFKDTENFIDKEINKTIKTNKGKFQTGIFTNNMKIIENNLSNENSDDSSSSSSSENVKENNRTYVSQNKNIFPEVRNNINSFILSKFNQELPSLNTKISDKNKDLSKKFSKNLSKNNERILISNVNLDSNSSKFDNLTYDFSNTMDNKNNSSSSYDDDLLSSNQTINILSKKNLEDKNTPSTINILPTQLSKKLRNKLKNNLSKKIKEQLIKENKINFNYSSSISKSRREIKRNRIFSGLNNVSINNLRLDTIDKKSDPRKLASDFIKQKVSTSNKFVISKEKSIYSNNSKDLTHKPQSIFSNVNNFNNLIATNIESFEIKSLYENFNRITKGNFVKDKEFQNNIIKFIKKYNKHKSLFNKKDHDLNSNNKQINSRTNLSNFFTLISMGLNARKQYEPKYDNEDKKKIKKKSKNNNDLKKFYTDVTTRKNDYENAKNNKLIYVNQDIYSMNKLNTTKLMPNNKFIENFCEGNDTAINFDNDNSVIKINDKINIISDKKFNDTLNEGKETCNSKKRKKKKKLKLRDG